MRFNISDPLCLLFLKKRKLLLCRVDNIRDDRYLSQIAYGQHLVNYGYYDLPITTIVIFYTDSIRTLLNQSIMKCKTVSHDTWLR